MSYLKENTLIEVNDDCDKLEMIDGSTWVIWPGHMPTVCTWIPTATIKIKKTNNNAPFNYELTNVNIGVSVWAMKEK